jgi:hypothetical protein
MSKRKVINKGYTLEIRSWENDGDLNSIKKVTYEDKELAIEIAKMCQNLFCSKNDKGNGIGNTLNGDENEVFSEIVNYVNEHPLLLQGDEIKEENIPEYIMEMYNDELLGYSEYYYSRVCESVKITYSPEDIYLEEIEF